MRRCLLAPLALLGWLSLGAPVSSFAATTPWSQHDPVRVRLVAPWEVAPRAGELWLGFEVELDPGWHIYWKNSGDAGFPPVIELVSEPTLRDPELLFPAPERYPIPGGLIAIGYEGRMIYPLRATIDAPESDTLSVTTIADYLVCEEDCIPFHDELALELPLGEPVRDDETAARLDLWRSRLPRPVTEVPGVEIDAHRQGDSLVVEVRGADPSTGSLDLFFEPVQGFSLGRPVVQTAGDGATFRVSLAPADARVGLPETLPLALVVTGLGSEPAPLAVEARLEVGAAQPSPVAEAATRPFDAPRLVVEGALLALTPSVLALLGLLLLWPQQGIRRALGPLSEIWPFAAGGFAGFLLLGLCLHLWSRLAVVPFFASPPAVAAAALAPLGLALWTWYGHPLDVERPRSLGRDLLGALLAPFLALPWFPAAGVLAPVAVGRATMPEIGLAAGGFAIPFLLTGALVTLRPLAAPGPWAGTRVRALGFLAAVSLIWVSYLLLDLIPTHRLAFLQLDWLLVALAVHMATVADRGRGLWWAVAFVLAVASVSLVAG